MAYDESSDQIDYVEAFEGLMDFQVATDALKWKAFQTAQDGNARLLYKKLPARSISTNNQFRKIFISKFSSCHYMENLTSHLVTVHQRGSENLKEYVTRF